MPIDTTLEQLHCIISYTMGAKIYVSDVTPIAYTPHVLRDLGIDVIIAVIEEISLPDDFRNASPVKHHHFCVHPASRLLGELKNIWRVIHRAIAREQIVLLYSRDPSMLTTVLIGFLLYSYADQGFLSSPFPKTADTWTLSFLRFIQKNYPLAFTRVDQFSWLMRYERDALDLFMKPFELVANWSTIN